MALVIKGYTIGQGSLGALIALVVLILCIVIWFIGKPLSGAEVLGLITALALARLL